MEKRYNENNIRQQMRDLRKNQLGLSQEEFSEKVNLSKDTISNIERGKYLPSVATLVNISNATCVSIDYFLRERE